MIYSSQARTLIFIWLVLLISVGNNFLLAKSNTSIEAFRSYLDETVPSLMAQYEIPGVAIAVIRGGELTWSGAYGYNNLALRQKTQISSIFRVESISKSLTSWGVMRLVEKNQIDLDKPLQQYLKNWQFPSSGYNLKAITVRQLLSHNSGLFLGTIGPGMEYTPGAELPPLREVMSQEVQLIQKPGSGFNYSNAGFNLLELLIEEVTGLSFADYMNGEILRPLGMMRSGFELNKSLEPLVPTGYDLHGQPVAAYVYPTHGAGGLLSPVEDIAQFVIAEMTGKYFVDHGVLSEMTIRQLHEPQIDVSGVFGFVADAYGLGHFIEQLPDGRRAVWHGGQGHGWMSHFHIVPESGNGIVILTNSQRSWPLFAHVLIDWAQWSGIGSVKMGKIVYAGITLRVLISVLLLIILWQFFRFVRSIRNGNCRWSPLSVFSNYRRMLQLFSGLVIILALTWNMTNSYSIVSAVFPDLAELFETSILTLSAMMIVSAMMSSKLKQ